MSGHDQAHLAELHALAAKRGISGYRLMRREELVAAIETAGEGAAEKEPPRRRRRGLRRQRERLEPEAVGPEAGQPDAEAEPEAERPDEPEAEPAREPEREEVEERRPRRARGRERLPAEDDAGSGSDDEPTEPVSGVLEVTTQRYGFIRLEGLEARPDDVYISASQVRRCELRSGDSVSGPARAPRRGERHRALIHVDTVNGAEPLAADRPSFDELTPVAPTRRIPLDGAGGDVLLRSADLLAPLAFGQRVLVAAAPRSGRTTLLRGLARAIASSGGAALVVLLVDERPEEATSWREALPGAELAIATADMAPRDQVAVAELALERARRRAEVGDDAVLVVDSLSRLAFAADGVAEVKRLFGSGRDLAEEGAGSLTVVATVVSGDDDADAERAVITTESALIALDRELAAAGIVPALDASRTSVSGEEKLRDPDELSAARRLRSQLADLAPTEAASFLRERIEGSASNAELLASL